MPEVIVENLHSKTIHIDSKSERLLDILLRETDWMHACGGKGKCTTCSAIICVGEGNLTSKSDAEVSFANLGRLNKNERLACQVVVTGNIRIKTPDSYKLPHLNYSE